MPKVKKKTVGKKKKGVMQVYNKKTKRWVKVDRETGKIVARKKSEGAYKGIAKEKTLTKSKKETIKTKKPKKKITHKLTYKPRETIGSIIRQGGQERLSDGKRTEKAEYTFKPDGKPDKTPNRIKDVGRANLRTQLVQLKSKKLQDLPPINDPDTAADILGGLSKNDREVVQIMFLNNKNKVIGIETAHIGSVNASITSPHEIMKTALLANANGIIFAHNHPSGDPTPSKEDITISKRLKESGKTVDVKLLDSIVVGKGKYYSMQQEGMM